MKNYLIYTCIFLILIIILVFVYKYNLKKEYESFANTDTIDLTLKKNIRLQKYYTYYCLDSNAVEWEVITNNNQYGSYGFSTPPIEYCDKNKTPASFILSLTYDDYNNLKKDNNNIVIKTKITYKVNNQTITKKTNFNIKL